MRTRGPLEWLGGMPLSSFFFLALPGMPLGPYPGTRSSSTARIAKVEGAKRPVRKKANRTMGSLK